MDILELISTVMDLSHKSEECSEEIKTINATLQSLQEAMKGFHEEE